MRVGKHEVYWHRPLVAYRTKSGRAAVLPDAPLGYLTAYDADQPEAGSAPSSCGRGCSTGRCRWPSCRLRGYTRKPGPPQVRNVRKLADAARAVRRQATAAQLARGVLGLARETTLGEAGWTRCPDDELASRMRGGSSSRSRLAPAGERPPRSR